MFRAVSYIAFTAGGCHVIFYFSVLFLPFSFSVRVV